MRGGAILAALLLTAAAAGCIGGTDDDELAPANTTPTDANETLGTLETEVLEGEAAIAVATPAASLNFNPPTASGPFQFPLERPDNATGYVLELTWDATTPLSEAMDLWVRRADTGNIPPMDPTNPAPEPPAATATGTSPLSLTVAEDDLDEDLDYEILVRAPSEMGVGAALLQPFELHVTTFIDQPVDEGYSALNQTAAR